jgi:hypothetical protein
MAMKKPCSLIRFPPNLWQLAVKRSSSRGVNTTHYAFDQYQLYDGLALPTLITQTTNGRSIQFITEAMDLNIRISPDTFKRY